MIKMPKGIQINRYFLWGIKRDIKKIGATSWPPRQLRYKFFFRLPHSLEGLDRNLQHG